MTNESAEDLVPSSSTAREEPGLTRRVALAGAAGLVGAGIVGAVGADAQTEDATAMAEEPSLYERLGGIFAIAAVVNRFSDEIITNPKLNENPALKAWNDTEAEFRLPGLKFGRTQWVAALAGGPYEYTGLPLEEAHKDSTSPPRSSPRSEPRSSAPSTTTRCRSGRRRSWWTPI